jgi:hypothetical protein
MLPFNENPKSRQLTTERWMRRTETYLTAIASILAQNQDPWCRPLKNSAL